MKNKLIVIPAGLLALALLLWGGFALIRIFRQSWALQNSEFVFNPNFGFVQKGYNATPGSETNFEGFRDAMDFTEKLPASCGLHRIMLLGSTSSFGKDIPIPETLGPKLEARLASMKLPAAVFNLSSPTQTAINGVAYAGAWAPKIRPEVTISAFGHMESFNWEEKFPVPAKVVSTLGIELKPEKKVENYLKSIRQIAQLTHPYGKLYVLPVTRSSKFIAPTASELKFSEATMKELEALGQKDFQSSPNLIFVESLKNLLDPVLYLADQARFSPKGLDAVVDELAPLIAEELKKRKPEECPK